MKLKFFIIVLVVLDYQTINYLIDESDWWENRLVYGGKVKNGQPEGIGMMSFRDGSTYLGEWAKGERSGHGVLTYGENSVGISYEGDWQNDYFNGQQLKNPSSTNKDKKATTTSQQQPIRQKWLETYAKLQSYKSQHNTIEINPNETTDEDLITLSKCITNEKNTYNK